MNTTLAINSMSCGHCVAQVTKTLTSVPGVKVISVAVGSAQISATEPDAVRAALASLAEAGYPALTDKPITTPSTDNSPRSSGCCGGAAGASANPEAADGKSSCCG